jgi:hypothetical protein
MTDHYKGKRIEELLAEIKKAEAIFNRVDPELLSDQLRGKLVAAKALVCINKAKLTALQEEK